MRAALSEKPDWITTDEQEPQILGMFFGGDFVSEHEWGVKPLKEAFGVQMNKPGIDRMKSTKHPEICVKTGTVNKKPAMMLICMPRMCASLQDGLDHLTLKAAMNLCDISLFGDGDLFSAWDEESFAVLALGKDNIQRLKAFHEILTTQNVCISICSKPGNPFSARALGICAEYAFSEDYRRDMLEKDRKEAELQKLVKDIGIIQELKDAGKKWFALIPSWAEANKVNSKYPIHFWLNPYDQKSNKYGWYTVENLRDWIKDIGPIPIKRR